MSPWLEMTIRFLLAVALGAALGFVRKRDRKGPGLRTHALVCSGAALFTLASIYGFDGDTVDVSRVAAGIVTGIGFIGAGVIVRGPRGDEVTGLTTAASIWMTAAIGLAAGAGMYLLSGLATAVTVIVLVLRRLRVE